MRGDDLQLRGEDGAVLPLQVGPDRQGWAVLPQLAAGRRAVFTVEPALRSGGPAMTVQVEGSHRHVSHAGLQSPQPMRIHPTEPFFNFAPQQAGAFTLRPGDPFVLRYRFIAFDGGPDARLIDDAWQDWATPVRAWVR